MPLTGTGDILGAAVKAAIDGVADKNDRDAIFKAMCTAILAHIVANGVITNAAGPGTIS